MEAVYGCSTPTFIEWSYGPQPFTNFTATQPGETLNRYVDNAFRA